LSARVASSYHHVSILFHHYKELKECISEVEEMEAKVGHRLHQNKGKSIEDIKWFAAKTYQSLPF
jgi:hypothetical protein